MDPIPATVPGHGAEDWSVLFERSMHCKQNLLALGSRSKMLQLWTWNTRRQYQPSLFGAAFQLLRRHGVLTRAVIDLPRRHIRASREYRVTPYKHYELSVTFGCVLASGFAFME